MNKILVGDNMNKTIDKVCMITGVGDGTGSIHSKEICKIRI